MTRPPPKQVSSTQLEFILPIEFLRLLFVAAPRDVIELPYDEEEVPLRERRRRGRASSGKLPESGPFVDTGA